jgi:methionyl-tRNA formyltransferase
MLQVLQQTIHRVVAVLSSPTGQSGTGASVWSLAAKLGYPTWSAKLVKDPSFAETIRRYHVDMSLNVHSLFVVCKEVLEAPLLGSYNLHPGPLPRYAGLNSVSWAIYRGEKMHGVSLHRMEPGIDTGPIVCQELFAIEPEETGFSLAAKCMNVGIPMSVRWLERVGRDPSAILEVQQDLSKREYFGREVPGGGRLSWFRPATQIFNFVRACDFGPFHSPWGHPRTALIECEFEIVGVRLTGKPTRVPPGTIGQVNNVGAEVACLDEWILVHRMRKGGKNFPVAAMLKTGDRFLE